jgi:hypothetical protein
MKNLLHSGILASEGVGAARSRRKERDGVRSSMSSSVAPSVYVLLVGDFSQPSVLVDLSERFAGVLRRTDQFHPSRIRSACTWILVAFKSKLLETLGTREEENMRSFRLDAPRVLELCVTSPRAFQMQAVVAFLHP